MKNAIRQVAARVPLELEEIDIEGSAAFKEKYGAEVPVLFIDGKKAFKYRVTAKQLEQRLRGRGLWARWGPSGKRE